MAIPGVMTISVNAAVTAMMVALSLCGVLVGCVLLLMTVVVALGLWKVLVGCILLLTVMFASVVDAGEVKHKT